MKVKVVQFQDCRICIFDEPCKVRGIICCHVPYWHLLPSDSLLEGNCKSATFINAVQNEEEFKKVIKNFIK